MSLQDVFYLVDIIYMIIAIGILVVIGYTLLAIKNKFTHLADTIDEKFQSLQKLADDPTATAITLGAKVANTAVKKVKSALGK